MPETLYSLTLVKSSPAYSLFWHLCGDAIPKQNVVMIKCFKSTDTKKHLNLEDLGALSCRVGKQFYRLPRFLKIKEVGRKALPTLRVYYRQFPGTYLAGIVPGVPITVFTPPAELQLHDIEFVGTVPAAIAFGAAVVPV